MTNYDQRLTEHNKHTASMSDFDAGVYLPMLDGIDINDEQKREYLGIIWDMMRMCVEMNISAENWGQIAPGLICAACDESTGIDSE